MAIAPMDDVHNVNPSLRDRLVQRIFIRLYGGWKSRTETPPKGRCWASDGKSVWWIWTDGGPIPKEATSVLWWMPMPIPDPPPPESPEPQTAEPPKV